MKSQLRKLVESEICLHLFQHPKDVRLFDIELLRGTAFEWAERLEIGPTIAALGGVYEYTDAITQDAEHRLKIMQFVGELSEESSKRMPTRSFSQLVAALTELETLERSAEPKEPAWLRHMRRAGAA